MTPPSPDNARPSDAPVPERLSDTSHLDRSLIHGIAWTAGAKWLSQLLSWAATLLIVRLLTPEDFGLMAMAMVFIGLVSLVNEFGMGAAIVRHRDLTRTQVAQINGLCVLFGLGAAVVTAAVAYPVSVLYATPDLVSVIAVLGLNFFITGFRTVPLAILERDMNFRKVAFNEAMQSILQNVATVVLAFMGYKYWTLVIGAILGALLSTLFAWRAVPTRLAWPRRRDIGPAVTFGSHLVTSRICWYVYSNADLFVAGKMLGKLAAGVYSVAMTLASIPVDKVSAMVVRVAPSILSAVQDDMPVMRRYVLLMTEGLAFVTLPVSVGMALVAPEFVVLLLGEQWRPAIVPLQLLSAYAAFRSIVPILPVVLQIIGRSKFAMQQSIFTVLVLPAAFVVGSHWGIDGIGWAWVIVYPLSTLPLFYVTFLCIDLRLSAYLKALWPALSTTAVMAIAVNAVQTYFAQKDALALQLALEVLTGMLIYPLAYGAMHYPRLKSLREALKLLRSQ